MQQDDEYKPEYNAEESVISRESQKPMTTRGQKYYQSNDEIIGSSYLRP
jgi:hypothetical protein